MSDDCIERQDQEPKCNRLNHQVVIRSVVVKCHTTAPFGVKDLSIISQT